MVHHWQGFETGDVETITSDYATDAVLITPDGLFKGQALIRSLFEKIIANMFPTKLDLAKRCEANR